MNGTFGEFVKRHSLPIGIGLMFLLTWPIDLAYASYLQLQIPFVVYLFLGWGFVIAAIAMTAFTLGKSGVVALLKRFLIWRVGGAWLAVDAISNVRRSIYLALQQHPRQPVDDDVVPCFCKHGWSVPADCEHGGRRPVNALIIQAALEVLVAVAVTLSTGADRLSRTQPRQVLNTEAART